MQWKKRVCVVMVGGAVVADRQDDCTQRNTRAYVYSARNHWDWCGAVLLCYVSLLFFLSLLVLRCAAESGMRMRDGRMRRAQSTLPVGVARQLLVVESGSAMAATVMQPERVQESYRIQREATGRRVQWGSREFAGAQWFLVSIGCGLRF